MFSLKFPQREVVEAGVLNLDMAESKEQQNSVSQVEPVKAETVATEENANTVEVPIIPPEESVDNWDSERYKNTLKNFRDQERELKAKEREARNKVESLEKSVRELSEKLMGKEQEEAEKTKSVTELAETRGRKLLELETELQREKGAQESRISQLQEKLEVQSKQINNLVDTTISEWPEKARALVPSGETASEVRLERMLTAQPLIKDLIESSNNSEFRANGPDPSTNRVVNSEKDAVEMSRGNKMYRAF